MSKILSAKYYQENKERLTKKAHKRYQNLCKKEKKEKKQQYGRKCNENLSKDEKQKLVEYRKKYSRMKKNRLAIKSNDLESSFEAINLFLKAYLNKNFESIYKNK